MTMTSPCPEPYDSTTAHKLAILEHTYPRWRITQRVGGMWSATRVVPPTRAQAAAGVHRYIIQPDLDALAAVLCQQLFIAHTIK
ncbi:hypothetical protein ACIBQ1_10180 [Nonomuraea sp. NPDC050153]|uniref:hypothetical protein n=1 Tax=Nonomuraea sp. NPDC050153 TaxID=3364359 RepID=UPI0037A76D67